MTSPTSDPRMVIIQRNPRSGTGKGREQLRILASRLKSLGYRVRMFANRAKMDSYVAQLPPSRELVCIVAAGGDGTVCDLVNRHPGIPLAVLPLGTENLMARYLGLSRCGASLADIIHRRKVRVLDSAMANGQRFLLMLSVGIDADIVQTLHQKRTGNIWKTDYVWPGIREFFRTRSSNYVATSADGRQTVSGSHVIVTNIPRYGLGLPFAPDASPDDHLLDVRAFHGTTRWQLLCHAAKLMLGLPPGDTEITRFSTNAVSLYCRETARETHSQCDGDPGPSTPIHIEIDPKSVSLIVP